MDFWSLIEELLEITEMTVLNKKQLRRFFENTIMDYLEKLQEDDLPALRAAIKMGRELQ